MIGAAKMLVDTLDIAEEICSEREIVFLESAHRQLQRTGRLSDKQTAWLERLYQRACESPH